MARSIPTPRSPDVPLDAEQAKSFYQGRIAMFAWVTCLLSLGFYVLGTLLFFSIVPGVHWSSACSTPVTTGTWQVFRRSHSKSPLSWTQSTSVGTASNTTGTKGNSIAAAKTIRSVASIGKIRMANTFDTTE